MLTASASDSGCETPAVRRDRTPALRPVRVRHYLNVMRERGVAPESLLEQTRVSIEQLKDPECRVSAADVRQVIVNFLSVTGDEAIGFEMGMRTELSTLGILGGALLSCRQVGETLQVWQRFSAPVIGIASRLNVERSEDGDLLLSLVEPDPDLRVRRFCAEELLGLVKRLGEAECGVTPRLMSAELDYPAPAHAATYRDILDCPAHFDRRQMRLRVSGEWARQSIVSHDDELHALCLSRCTELAGRSLPRAGFGAVAEQIYALALRSPQAPPRLDDAARALHTSSRTLKRRLQAEGTSFQEVVQRCRRDLAIDYLGAATLAHHRIAERLGYADERAFRRAFRSWTGVSPAEFRQRAQGAD